MTQPTLYDQERADRQRTFWALLHSDYGKDDCIITDFMQALIGDALASIWGPPDTSGNTQTNFAKQLSTPGLYGRPPRVTHPTQEQIGRRSPDLSTVDAFIALLDKAGLWSTGQERSRKAIGMGDALVMFGWTGKNKDGTYATLENGGKPALRFLRPQDCYVEVDPFDPDVPILFAERAGRTTAETGKMEEGWDVFDVRDPANPSFSFRRPNPKAGEPGEDLFGEAWTAPSAPASSGDLYLWRLRSRAPVVPVVRWTAYDTLQFWHDLSVRDQARGALHSIAHWTYATRCARAASGSSVVMVNVQKPVGVVSGQGQAGQIESLPMQPGSFTFFQGAKDTAQAPQVVTVGPGANLEEVAGFALHYELEQFIRAGISPTDIQRVSADPASGAAMAISNQGRREFSVAIEPMFRRADLRAIAIMAAACRAWGGEDYPDEDYEIVYDIPAESPQAQQGRRDHQSWLLANGLRSRVDLYVAEHPGVRRERAIEALRRVREEEAAIGGGAMPSSSDGEDKGATEGMEPGGAGPAQE